MCSRIEVKRPSLLNLANDLARPRQALHHLLALLAPADGVVRLLQQVVHVLLPVKLLEELGLHGFFGESGNVLLAGVLLPFASIGFLGNTYCTRLSMIALGTISIIVLLTML